MLTEADLFPEPTHKFWNMAKGSSLYVGEKDPVPRPGGWRGKVVRVLHRKAEGATDGAKNLMLLRQMDEEWTPIELKTWASKTISGCPEANVGGNQLQLGNFAPIKDKV